MHGGKTPVVIEKPSVNLIDTGRFQGLGKFRQPVCGQRGVAAACQYKVAIKHAFAERAGDHQLRAKLVICPQMIQRIGGGNGFGHARWCKALGLVFSGEQAPISQCRSGAAKLALQAGFFKKRSGWGFGG